MTAVRHNIIEKKDASFKIGLTTELTERMKSCSKLIVL